MTLTEFLLARIRNDEAYWRLRVNSDPGDFLAKQMVRDCDAKCRIVERAVSLSEWDDMGSSTSEDGWFILEHMALPYADHPDYHEGWKP